MITCGFVGLGLIGGSIARALKANRKDIVIIACDPNEETVEARNRQKIAEEPIRLPATRLPPAIIFSCARPFPTTMRTC